MDTTKQDAWTTYLLTVKIRYVDACFCSSCEEIRAKFQVAYERQRLSARLARKVAAIVLAWMVVSATANATTYYVAPSGSDAQSCATASAITSPKQTINDAMRCLAPGDTLLVRGGTYAEEIRTPPGGTSWSAPTTIKAYTGEVATLRPSGTEYNVKYAGAGYSILDGLHLDTTNVATGTVIRITEGAHHIRITGCEIFSTNQRNAQGILADGTGHEFLGNEIHHVADSHFVHGIYLSGDTTLIQGNHIHHVGGYGVHIFNGTDGVSAHHNRVLGNTIHDTGMADDATTGIILSSGTGNQAIGNTVYGNKRGIEVNYGGDGATVACNTVHDNHGGGGFGIGVASSNVVVQDNTSYNNDQNYMGAVNVASGAACTAVVLPPPGSAPPRPRPTNLRVFALPLT